MWIDLEALCRKVEQAEPTVHCRPLPGNAQAAVAIDKCPDAEVSLLVPYTQKHIRSGCLDDDLYTDLLFSNRRIASF